MVTKAELEKAMAEIYAKFDEYRSENANRFRQEREQMERRLTKEAD
jgi:hypothetical protein